MLRDHDGDGKNMVTAADGTSPDTTPDGTPPDGTPRAPNDLASTVRGSLSDGTPREAVPHDLASTVPLRALKDGPTHLPKAASLAHVLVPNDVPLLLPPNGLLPAPANHLPRAHEVVTSTDTVRAPNDLTGYQCGPFTIVRLLGEGGMGQVWLARADELGGATAAIKVLLREANRRPESLRRFRQEQYAIGATEDDCVVKIFGGGSLADGRQYILMEYCSGGSLSSLLENTKTPLSIEFLFSVLSQAASALAAAHKAKIIHRDFKPANILLSTRDDGFTKARLSDFGIAKLFGDRLDNAIDTGSGKVLGSLGYMAPEQARALRNLDHRVDIYAFGVAFYECLTGRRPYLGRSLQEQILSVVGNAPFPPPNQFRGDIPPELNNVIMRCLEHDREKRFQSIEEVVHAYSRTIPTGPTLVGYAAPRFADRSVLPTAITSSNGIGPAVSRLVSAATTSTSVHRRRIAKRLAGAFAAGLLVGGGAVGFLSRMRDPERRDVVSESLRDPAAGAPHDPRDTPPPTHSPEVAATAGRESVFALASKTSPSTAAPADAGVSGTGQLVHDARAAVTEGSASPRVPDSPAAPPPENRLPAHRDPSPAPAPPSPAPHAATWDPEAAKIGMGVIRFIVQPGWAKVWVDGVDRGTTPVRAEVTPGVHKVLMVGEGHREGFAVTVSAAGESVLVRKNW